MFKVKVIMKYTENFPYNEKWNEFIWEIYKEMSILYEKCYTWMKWTTVVVFIIVNNFNFIYELVIQQEMKITCTQELLHTDNMDMKTASAAIRKQLNFSLLIIMKILSRKIFWRFRFLQCMQNRQMILFLKSKVKSG